MRVAVVGAGVVGLCSAVAIKEAFPGSEVTILAAAFTPNTTGDGSAGLLAPYIVGDTDPQKVLYWTLLTRQWVENFWKTGLAEEVGACLIPTYRLYSDTQNFKLPEWASVVYGVQQLTNEQLERLSKNNNTEYSAGLHFLTYTCEPIRLLPWLTNKFQSMNGKLVRREVTDLSDLKNEGFDVVINCTGLGAEKLVPDQQLKPVRGQVMRVQGPWLLECFLEENHHGNYVIPNIDSVVLGGTHQEGDYDCAVRETDTKLIREGCERLYPSVKECKTLKEWVGLRPSRPSVRLEPEIVRTRGEKDILIIHNYGHGGSGVTLGWGCAVDVVKIMRQQLQIKNLSKL